MGNGSTRALGREIVIRRLYKDYMIALLVLLSFAAFGVYAIYADRRDRRLEKATCEKRSKDFMESELAKPFYVVRVITKDGTGYTTDPFKPISELDYWGCLGHTVYSVTSLEQARSFIENQVKWGRYYHGETCIPMCDIRSMEALKNES